MAFNSRPYVNRYRPSNRFPTGVRWLLIVTISVSILYYILSRTPGTPQFMDSLALIPLSVVQGFALWQPVTYLFLHGGIMHLLWNMLALWMFGMELERTWGTARFLKYYFLCGISAGFFVIVAAYLFGGITIPTVGCSGAIYGILVAYAIVFPDRTLLFGFLIPMKAKWFVAIIGAVVLLQSFGEIASGKNTGIAVLAHLGGLVTGYFYLRGRRLYAQSNQLAAASFKEYKLRRAKKKFEIYLKKQDPRRGPWVN
jgi:membrane associated rhomboid family serine protease